MANLNFNNSGEMCSITRIMFPVFKQHEICGPKRFFLESMTFPSLENAFSNFVTFQDFS